MWTAAILGLRLWAGPPELPASPGSTPPASGDQVAVAWSAPADCPDRDAVADQIAALLGPGTGSAIASVEGRLDGQPGDYGLSLAIERDGQRETRELRAPDCTLLSRAGALIVAVTIDALATAEHLDGLAATEAAFVPVPAAPQDPVTREPAASEDDAALDLELPADDPPSRGDLDRTQPETPRPRTPWIQSVTLGVAAGLGLGFTPGPTAVIEGQLGWRYGPVRITAGGFHSFRQTIEIERDFGTRSALSGGWLRGCYAWTWRFVDIPLCGGVDVALMHGRGVGTPVQPNDVRDLWAALAAGPGLEVWPTPWFAIAARVEGLVAMRRPAMFLLVAGDSRETYRMPTAALRVMLGPLFRFGAGKTGSTGAR
jgi:hypothetical protein